MPIYLPNPASGESKIIEFTNQFALGIENEMTHNKKINTPGTSLVSATSYTDLGDRVDNLWAGGIGDRQFIQVGFSGLYIPTSGSGNFSAAIFIGAVQLKNVVANGAVTNNEATGAFNIATTPGKQWMGSNNDGLGVKDTVATSVTSGITTGMAVVYVGSAYKGGLCNIMIPAAILAPFSLGIRFKVSAGSVTISERKLWARVCSMTN